MLPCNAYNWRYFNSRPREGANQAAYQELCRHPISIPAPARGRTSAGQRLRPSVDFNSRPREGANMSGAVLVSRMYISIPAPARGRTGYFPAGPLGEYHFNSRPREGANKRSLSPGVPAMHFNSRPREGANYQVYYGTKADCIFQFPPPRGGEHWASLKFAIW